MFQLNTVSFEEFYKGISSQIAIYFYLGANNLRRFTLGSVGPNTQIVGDLLSHLSSLMDHQLSGAYSGILYERNDSDEVILYLITHLRFFLYLPHVTVGQEWSPRFLDQFKESWMQFNGGNNRWLDPVRFDFSNKVLLIHKIYYWGLSKDPNYWKKRDEEASLSNRPFLNGELLDLMRRVGGSDQLEPYSSISLPWKKAAPRNLGTAEVEKMKRQNAFAIRGTEPLPDFLELPGEAEFKSASDFFASADFASSLGLHVDTLLPQNADSRVLQIVLPQGRTLSAFELLREDGSPLRPGIDYRILSSRAARAFFVETSPRLDETAFNYRAKYEVLDEKLHMPPREDDFPFLPRDKFLELAAELRAGGFTSLAAAMDARALSEEPISLIDLEQILKDHSKYSFSPEDSTATHLDWLARFARFLDKNGS